MTHQPAPQLWATAPAPDHATAAIACTAAALEELGRVPGAEEDWQLLRASQHLRHALEMIQGWQERVGGTPLSS